MQVKFLTPVPHKVAKLWVACCSCTLYVACCMRPECGPSGPGQVSTCLIYLAPAKIISIESVPPNERLHSVRQFLMHQSVPHYIQHTHTVWFSWLLLHSSWRISASGAQHADVFPAHTHRHTHTQQKQRSHIFQVIYDLARFNFSNTLPTSKLWRYMNSWALAWFCVVSQQSNATIN